MQRFDGVLWVYFLYEPNQNHFISKVKSFRLNPEF